MVHFKINNMDVVCEENTTILAAARENHIDIPTLCNYPDLEIKSECRVCVVEIEGQKKLFTSCSTMAREGMIVNTNSPKVLNARKTIIELILANHDASCTACPKNLNCELQSLANKLGIDENRFPTVLEVKPIDDKNPVLIRNINRCIKCGRCIDVCKNVQAMGVLDVMGRSKDMEITPAYGRFLSDEFCVYCGQCSSVCPVGAIIEKDETDKVWEAINNPHFHVIVQVAPAVRVSLGEELGMEPGAVVTEKVVAALKYLGFDAVYDTDFTADLTIMEEGTELIDRVVNGGTLPMMTSCCPGWISFAEQKYPEILDNISSCKSPQQMFGALAKSYYPEKMKIDPKNVYVVSIMPCTAKKYEAQRKEMRIDKVNPDVDVVLTTRELGKMIRQMGINFEDIEEIPFDKPFGITTGAAAIFGATGGVMEAALRTVYEIVNKEELTDLNFTSVRGLEGLKEAEVNLGGQTVKVAVAHTLENAKIMCEQVKAGTSPYTFIEVMTCAGGCIGGGGQPYGTTKEVRQKRIDAIYQVDENMEIRKSHKNPDILALYEDYLEKPNSHKAHHLLHTYYHSRNK
jgi:NADH-quinone oxidoreductase subunit G/NADP-reducing hydrogenase subunit HndD